ncbi:hypothetical protein [Mangrovibacter phragmitis]|uniref:hypothetical protein n=1 Tax=Mangrovibacter phragmitis TaxID=1691903 RepID=UPI00336A8D63
MTTNSAFKAAGARHCICLVTVCVPTNYTGRAISDCLINLDDHIATLDGFMGLARQPGWTVTPVTD